MEVDMRKLILNLAALVLVAFLAQFAEAQQPANIPRIGYLTASSVSAGASFREVFREGLRQLGYVESQNIIIEWRYADGRDEQIGRASCRERV